MGRENGNTYQRLTLLIMEPINYRQFVITVCEHGGFHYTPEWSDGSGVAMHDSTVEECKKRVDEYWTEQEESNASDMINNQFFL